MSQDNFYYKIYSKKTSAELMAVLERPEQDDTLKLIALEILEERGEVAEEYRRLKSTLKQDISRIAPSEIENDRYQTFWRRAAANSVDGFLLRMAGTLLGYFAITESAIGNNMFAAVDLLLPFAYSILLHSISGQTIGKMLLGVKVFDKSEKTVIRFRQAFLRDSVPLTLSLFLGLFFANGWLGSDDLLSTSAAFMIWIVVLWSFLEIVTMLFNSRRRALHDLIAGTVVLRVKN
ncbi:RDD family protein [Mangrovibacterium diazotrophicum]|uniref:Putative RDD family membrane protein YckC n=1 Tax=Mangrovibacterium diazotrophicum TaxID=1261403 RepID=A0A419W3Z8_9BACT|nr:RDD family protein [Mangrovibacterium diazotrophicum]RKD90174.1 putative RDD family membrane protein YckC [Mangrovibacterium diazotrophicum]